MCLCTPHVFYPYNKTNIRWKVLVVHRRKRYAPGIVLTSPYKGVMWKVGTTKRAKSVTGYDNSSGQPILPKDPNFGIHVFVTKKDAMLFAEQINVANCAIVVKLEVSRFNTAGTYQLAHRDEFGNVQWEYRKSETWKRAKILRVFTPNGKLDITRNYT